MIFTCIVRKQQRRNYDPTATKKFRSSARAHYTIPFFETFAIDILRHKGAEVYNYTYKSKENVLITLFIYNSIYQLFLLYL